MIFQILTIRSTIKDIKEKASDPEQALTDFIHGTITPFVAIGYSVFGAILGLLVWWGIATGSVFVWVFVVLVSIVIAVFTVLIVFVYKIIKKTIKRQGKNFRANLKGQMDGNIIDVEVKENINF